MTYEEAYELAYAIGYHRGRMVARGDMRGASDDALALEALMDRAPNYWFGTIIDRHERGKREGAAREA